MNLNLGRRGMLALRFGGYALLALVTFVYCLHLTFPYDRVRDKVIESLSSKYDVTIAGVDRSLVPGRFALTGVTLASRPAAAGQPITTMYFKRVEVDLKFLPLLGKRLVAGLDISTGQGGIVGTVEQDGTTTKANFTLRHVPLATLPGITDAVGLPMDGNANGKLSLRLPKGDWTKAVAKFDLSCNVGCAVGDGVTKIYPKPQRPADAALYRDGMTVPKIDIERFAIGIDIAKGVAGLRTFEFVSDAGNVEVDFDIKLARAIGNSTISGCLRYKCSAEFQRKYPGLCIGSPIVDEQGMLNVKLTGQVSKMRRLPQRCDTGGTGGGGGGDSAGVPSRPTLETIPDAPVEVTPTVPTPTPPMPVVEPPPLDRKPMPMGDDVGGSVPSSTTTPPSYPQPPLGSSGSAGSMPSPGAMSPGSTTAPTTVPPPVPSPSGYTPGGGGYTPGGGGSAPPPSGDDSNR